MIKEPAKDLSEKRRIFPFFNYNVIKNPFKKKILYKYKILNYSKGFHIERKIDLEMQKGIENVEHGLSVYSHVRV